MLDSVDKKILACLSENSRMNASAIGTKVNMSVSAVIERIKRLESTGIIKSYTVIIDPFKIGRDLLAFIDVSTDYLPGVSATGAMDEFAATHPEVMECHVVTGNSDFLLKVCTDTTKSLEKLLDDLKRVKGVTSTRTSIVMSSVKNRVSPVDPGDEKL
ncbi:MAG: Lrp/AsnC family transcriptional regulator [Eubacteriales bacterium]|jgi:Lrp/AsnC family leucine-responsive transcriptional regulator|nr:Lrp/AsnC family transcriptional regulator [Clostridiales bacterium]